MDFKLSLSKPEITVDGLAKIIFGFNTTQLTHVLSYKFTTYYEGNVIKSFYPHDYVENINGAYTKEFNEVEILKTYFGGAKKTGIYSIEVEIRYLVCGENQIDSVLSSAEITVV